MSHFFHPVWLMASIFPTLSNRFCPVCSTLSDDIEPCMENLHLHSICSTFLTVFSKCTFTSWFSVSFEKWLELVFIEIPHLKLSRTRYDSSNVPRTWCVSDIATVFNVSFLFDQPLITAMTINLVSDRLWAAGLWTGFCLKRSLRRSRLSMNLRVTSIDGWLVLRSNRTHPSLIFFVVPIG